jgi:molybdopterin converting factor small subunit
VNVRVQFFAQLRDAAGAGELTLDLPVGATVADLLAKIYAQKPILRQHDASILVGAGVEFVTRDYVVASGDEIALMPPVQGG